MTGSTLKEVARSNRKAPTPAAHRLWRFLRGRRLNGYKFTREVVIGCYIADFVCRSHKIVIEVDGEQHGEEAVIAYDNKRTEFLGEEGYQVVRIWNNEVFENIVLRSGAHPSEAAMCRAQALPTTRVGEGRLKDKFSI